MTLSSSLTGIGRIGGQRGWWEKISHITKHD